MRPLLILPHPGMCMNLNRIPSPCLVQGCVFPHIHNYSHHQILHYAETKTKLAQQILSKFLKFYFYLLD